MCGAILLITDVVFDASAPVVTTIAAVMVFAWFWFAMPMMRRTHLDEGPPQS